MSAVAAASRLRQDNRRLLGRRNATSITGQFNSIRDDGVLRVFQSRPEFLHLAILDAHSNVEAFETQPDTIDLPNGGAYTADVLVTFRRGRRPVYREVKRLADLLKDADLNGRYEDIVAGCEQRGADFEIVVEGYWLEPVRWSITSLLRHSHRRATPLQRDLVRAALEDGALPLSELMTVTGLAQSAKFAALSLCVTGHADVRRDRAITQDTLVRLTENGR